MGILFCLPDVRHNTMCCVDVRSRNNTNVRSSKYGHKLNKQKEPDNDTDSKMNIFYMQELEMRKKEELLAEEELW